MNEPFSIEQDIGSETHGFFLAPTWRAPSRWRRPVVGCGFSSELIGVWGCMPRADAANLYPGYPEFFSQVRNLRFSRVVATINRRASNLYPIQGWDLLGGLVNLVMLTRSLQTQVNQSLYRIRTSPTAVLQYSHGNRDLAVWYWYVLGFRCRLSISPPSPGPSTNGAKE